MKENGKTPSGQTIRLDLTIQVVADRSDSQPQQQESGEWQSKDLTLQDLKPCQRLAYWSYEYARTLSESETLRDGDAHDILLERLNDNQALAELDEYSLPTFDTWARHLRSARKHLGEQKNTPAHLRNHGSSIVHSRDI